MLTFCNCRVVSRPVTSVLCRCRIVFSADHVVVLNMQTRSKAERDGILHTLAVAPTSVANSDVEPTVPMM